MLPTLYPGANRDDIPDTLRRLSSKALDASNVHVASDRLWAYLQWVTDSVRMLQHRVSAADIDRLITTSGYERLLSAAGSLTGGLEAGKGRVLNGLLTLEIQQRIADLDEAAKDLDTQIQLWSGFAEFTIPDTSFYIKHKHKLKSIDFHDLLGAPRHQPVRVIAPMIVLDELDRLKDSGDQHTRWRAGHTLGVMDEAFANTALPGLIPPPEGADPVNAGVILDVVFDPPRHVRLPIADDEIIERALAVQSLAGRRAPLLTFDTSQSSRARHAGLPFKKLTRPLGDEPPETRSRKAKQAPSSGM